MSMSSLEQLRLEVACRSCANSLMLLCYCLKLFLIEPMVKHALDDPQTTLKLADELPVRESWYGNSTSCSKLLLNLLSFGR